MCQCLLCYVLLESINICIYLFQCHNHPGQDIYQGVTDEEVRKNDSFFGMGKKEYIDV